MTIQDTFELGLTILHQLAKLLFHSCRLLLDTVVILAPVSFVLSKKLLQKIPLLELEALHVFLLRPS